VSDTGPTSVSASAEDIPADALQAGGSTEAGNTLAFTGQTIVQNIPPVPVQMATVPAERLVMLSTAPRDRLGEWFWPAIAGLFGSVPSIIPIIIDIWNGKTVELSLLVMANIGITSVFLALLLFSIIGQRGKSSRQILEEILNPSALPRKAWWKTWN